MIPPLLLTSEMHADYRVLIDREQRVAANLARRRASRGVRSEAGHKAWQHRQAADSSKLKTLTGMERAKG